MALNAYLALTSAQQGQIIGGSTQAGREDMIVVHEVQHQIRSSRDAASGLATGKRQHKPITITKELDKSSPLLYNILCNNENITEFRLQFWSPSRSGQEVHHFTIELEDATIAGIRFIMPDNRDPELMRLKEYEQISFMYRKITWTYEDGGITAADDWYAERRKR